MNKKHILELPYYSRNILHEVAAPNYSFIPIWFIFNY